MLDRGVDRVLADGVQRFGVDDAAAVGPLGDVVRDVLDRAQEQVVAGELRVVSNRTDAADDLVALERLDAGRAQSVGGALGKPSAFA